MSLQVTLLKVYQIMRPKGYTQTNAFINSIFQYGWNVISQSLCKQIKVINLSLSHHLGIKQENKNSPFNTRTRNGKVKQVRVQIEISESKYSVCEYLCNSVGKRNRAPTEILSNLIGQVKDGCLLARLLDYTLKSTGFHSLKKGSSQ